MPEAPTPHDTLSELSPAEKAVVTDYRLTFRYSRGHPPLQYKLMVYAARQHTPEEIEALGLEDPKYKRAIEGLKVPGNHRPITRLDAPLGLQKGFQALWTDQVDAYRHIVAPKPPSIPASNVEHYNSLDNETLLLSIAHDMAKRDIHYLKKEQRDSESFIRRHGLLETPTGSKIFDGLFGRIGEIVKDPPHDLTEQPRWRRLLSYEAALKHSLRRLPDSIASLQTEWQRANPDSSFFPDMGANTHSCLPSPEGV